jgi:hypothetical protein
MRLSSLDDSIQDALATRERLTVQINAILNNRPVDDSAHAQDEAALASRYLSAERKFLKQSVKQRDVMKQSISIRKRAIDEGAVSQAQAEEELNVASHALETTRKNLKTTLDDIHGQRRRICEELLDVFPIEPTQHALVFTICGLLLPNTSFEDSNEDVVAAALGHVARLVDMLQYYLSVPLPYPVVPFGSRSIIRDEISTLSDTQRAFPLYGKGTIGFRFEYGVFLLNKNIECLAESQGLKVIDIRHTLPNLKYLLYVCSAGTSELPARKAGGVRGLLAGRFTPISSRRGSPDDGTAALLRNALESNHGNGAKNRNLLTTLPFDTDHTTSLRTRGLRENIVR